MKTLYAVISVLMLVSLVHSGCCTGGSGTCSGSGSCTYTCNSGWYDCDGNAVNGCESNTPCSQYAFHRFTFNLSSYEISNIDNLTYCFDGLYVGTDPKNATLQYYNVTSTSWIYDQNIGTSTSVKCKTFTNVNDVINSTSKIFQFAVRGNVSAGGSVTIYTNNINVSIMYRSLVAGQVSWTAGKFNNALNFNGTGEYVNVSNSPTLNITGNTITLEAWIKVAGPPGGTSNTYYQIVGKDTGDVQYRLLLTSGRNMLLFQAGGAAGNLSNTFTPLALNTWHHIAVSWNGTNANYYVDGASVGSPLMGSTMTGTLSDVQIGKTFGSNYYFNGTIDEVAIYSRAKSAEEIYADANPVYVKLNITDPASNQVAIRNYTSYYVNPGGNNTFSLRLGGNGVLNMTVGAYAGLYSLRAYLNNVLAASTIAAILSGSSDTKAILPIELTIAGQNFKNLIVKEK